MNSLLRTRDIVVFAGLALLATQSFAANYYVANDGNDGNAGTSTNAPFRTVGHAMAVEGGSDTVYLKRGDVFREGGLSLSGDMNAYGDPGDPLPVICGSVAITNWTVYSNSIYVADVAETIEHLFVDNALMMIARYPNTGWVTPDTYDENNDGSGTTINAAQLGLNPRNAHDYWTGATIRWRRHSWWFETRSVTQYYSFGKLYLDGSSIIQLDQGLDRL